MKWTTLICIQIYAKFTGFLEFNNDFDENNDFLWNFGFRNWSVRISFSENQFSEGNFVSDV